MPDLRVRRLICTAEEASRIHAGTQTQVRRPVKPQPRIDSMGNACWKGRNYGQSDRIPHLDHIPCPLGPVGSLLWIAEPHNLARDTDGSQKVIYRDDTAVPLYRWTLTPRWASRTTVEIIGERVERDGDRWDWVVDIRRVK